MHFRLGNGVHLHKQVSSPDAGMPYHQISLSLAVICTVQLGMYAQRGRHAQLHSVLAHSQGRRLEEGPWPTRP